MCEIFNNAQILNVVRDALFIRCHKWELNLLPS